MTNQVKRHEVTITPTGKQDKRGRNTVTCSVCGDLAWMHTNVMASRVADEHRKTYRSK